MTFIVGATMVIGGDHPLRSGVDRPETVLVLRADKRVAWVSSLGLRRPFKASRLRQSGPSGLLLEGSSASYEYRYLVTDALLWWANPKLMPLDSEDIEFLRACTDISELYSQEEPHECLQRSRDKLEATNLRHSISIFLAATTGDESDLTIPPTGDWVAGMEENLRHLDIQFHLSFPVARREIPGMSDKIVEQTAAIYSGQLDLFGHFN